MVHRQMIAELLGQILNFDHRRALSISLGRAMHQGGTSAASLPAAPKQACGKEKWTTVSPGIVCGRPEIGCL
ncbi:hypothetical protein DSCW_62880 [Desulfosarcina widdelii]|uniref:Uncharacterized protein n=1 Tax=Desulfosarcina widdelii TaxID=947919 RepID=A0A5K7ZGG9_9BACT|nr:hypothetical protein DSCW_62880 [Desulfosarcina widdelii]